MPAILGSGEHRYRVVESWAKLPEVCNLSDLTFDISSRRSRRPPSSCTFGTNAVFLLRPAVKWRPEYRTQVRGVAWQEPRIA
jgi:hypothetical protein